MKNKIIFVILILLSFSNISLAFTGITTVEYAGGFKEQILDNYLNRSKLYNNTIIDTSEINYYGNYWGPNRTGNDYIVSINNYIYEDLKNASAIYESGSYIRGNFNQISKGTLNTEIISSITTSQILYNPYVIFTDNNATEVKYRFGALINPVLYITDENDGSLTIYKPQAAEIQLLNLIIHDYNTNEIINTVELLNEEYDEYLTGNRFWTFVGEDIKALNLTNDGKYFIRIRYKRENYNELYANSSPVFSIGNRESTGGEDIPGDDNNGGENIDTGKIEQELGNINNSIQQNNDYISQNPVYDENGNLSEEQPGLIGKILKGFWDILVKFFDWLMVPDEEQISDIVDDVLDNDLISESVLGLPLQLISKFLNLFENRTYTDWIISWDDISFKFTEKDGSEINMKMFDAYSFNISEFVRNDAKLSEIYSYYIILINFGAVCGLVYWGAGLVKGLMGIENDMPGANDETESPAVSSTPETSGESDAEALERYLQKNYNDYAYDYNEIRQRRTARGLPSYNYKSQVVGRYKSILNDMKAGRYKKK